MYIVVLTTSAHRFFGRFLCCSIDWAISTMVMFFLLADTFLLWSVTNNQLFFDAMIIAKIDEYVPIEFSPAIYSQDFEGMPTLLFHSGLELFEARECIRFLLDEVHSHHSSVVINEEEKISSSTKAGGTWWSLDISMHQLKWSFSSPRCFLEMVTCASCHKCSLHKL